MDRRITASYVQLLPQPESKEGGDDSSLPNLLPNKHGGHAEFPRCDHVAGERILQPLRRDGQLCPTGLDPKLAEEACWRPMPLLSEPGAPSGVPHPSLSGLL